MNVDPNKIDYQNTYDVALSIIETIDPKLHEELVEKDIYGVVENVDYILYCFKNHIQNQGLLG